MTQLPRNLLVCKVNGLGDLVAFLPTLHALTKLVPEGRITAMVPDRHRALVHATVDSVQVIGVDPAVVQRPQRHTGRFLALALQLRRLKFDAAMSSHDERSGVALLQLLARVPERFGFSDSCRLAGLYNRRVLSSFERSMIANDFELVRTFAGAYSLEPPPLHIPSPVFRAPVAGSPLAEDGPTMVIHPFAKYQHKRWPWECFRELILRVKAERPDVRVLVLTDGVGLDLRGLPARAVAPGTTDELCRALAEADVVVANNSGPMNVAWYLGVPLVLLSGPSPRYWSPPAESLTHEFRDRAACAPCEGPRHTPGRCLNAASPMACMLGIKVEEVTHAVLRMLERASAEMRRDRLRRLGYELGAGRPS